MSNNENLLDVLKTIFKWKMQIFYVCAIAVVGSILLSLTLSNYFKATTIFLAVSPDQANPESLYGTGGLKTEYYGNENDIDRLMTIAESAELINFLVDSFKLYEHYDINPALSKAQFRVQQKFSSLYEVTKTKRDAIELSIEDKDKELAAQMANAARKKINEIAGNLIKAGQIKTIQSYQANIENKEALLKVLGDSLMVLRQRYGIYNILAQSEALATQVSESEAQLTRSQGKLNALLNTPGIPRDTISFLKANISGLEEQYKKLNEKMSLFNEGLAEVGVYERQYIEANQSLSEDKERLKQNEATQTSNIPALILVEEAQVPIVKSRPKRSLIVLGAGAIAFFFSVIGVLLLDTYKNINWREIYHAK
ncbi:MAG TPA: hypothetical protein PKA00_01535 [Saprospiraceae bacterium]|nr:hypothetical protein [Saprospiraceae bacterium]HMQ81551.1 hypothetical protein [Saprospiraceae bacterium]